MVTSALAALNAVSDVVSVRGSQVSLVTLHVSGTYVGTVTIQFAPYDFETGDFGTFVNLESLTADAEDGRNIDMTGYWGVRCEMTSYTSGTANVTIAASQHQT